MVAGTGKADELLVCMLTAAPPIGARPLTVALSVANPPVAKLGGVMETELRVRATADEATVTVAFWLEPP